MTPDHSPAADYTQAFEAAASDVCPLLAAPAVFLYALAELREFPVDVCERLLEHLPIAFVSGGFEVVHYARA